jgi:peptide/nickel transport system permease protein
MRSYLLRRMLLLFPTMIGITLITFVIIQLAPGSPAELKIRADQTGALGEQYTREVIEQTKKLYGLDKPIHTRYLIWLRQVATLNFGESYKDHRPVIDIILERIPVSLQLSLTSIFLVYLFSIPIGVFSAVRQKSLADRALTVGLFILYSLPSFWVAMMLIYFFGGGQFFHWFPVYGLSSEAAESFGLVQWFLDRLWHLVLPVVCLTYSGLAFISRQQRAAMLEVIRQDYIRTARAKGLPEKMVIFKHAMRNSLIPIVTLAAALFPSILGGSVIIESIFSIPGMGKLGFDAILSRDYPVVMGDATISAFLTLIGILVADITYTLVDPRITFEAKK